MLYEGKLNRVENRRDEAINSLEAGIKISENVGHGFTGARLMGALALSLSDPKAKSDALNEGEKMLQAGSVSHNHFFFYPDAIEVSLEIGDWDSAERYSNAFEDFTKPEPLPWSEFFIARGRTLAAWRKGLRDSELITNIQDLRHEAENANMTHALPALEAVLNAAN